MDLATRYLGLELKHPIIASASPLTSTLDGIRTLEDAGAAAVVMASLFEEQVLAEDTAYAMYTEHGSYSQPESGTYFPVLPDYDHGVSGHLDTLRRAVEAVDIPVIASLNAVTTEGWVAYSAKLEQAGAAALELNVHFIPADPAMSSQDVEAHYIEIVRAVKRTVKIPVALKLSSISARSGTWPTTWHALVPMVSSCSIASISLTSTWTRCRSSRKSTSVRAMRPGSRCSGLRCLRGV